MRKFFSNPGFAWVPGLAARTPARSVDDSRFTDEEILTVVRAGESGMKLADLCEATGISVSTYYEWKARYSGLTPQQLHEQRQRTRSQRRRLTMLACAVAVAAIAVGGLMITRRTDAAARVPAMAPTHAPSVASAGAATPSPASSATAAPSPAASAAAAASSTASPGATASPAAGSGSAGPAAIATATEAMVAKGQPAAPAARAAAATHSIGMTPGVTRALAASSAPDRAVVGDPNAYSVQVAAVPDLQQARVALEKLAAAGYPAHITTTTVNRVEMYRVRVGPLVTRAAAEQVVARLRQEGYASPWMTR